MWETNESLLQRLRHHQREEDWQAFHAQYAGPIRRYARRLGLDESTAGEVTQQTFVCLARILPTFHYDPARGRFRNFLLTIVHRLSLAEMRREQARIRREVSLDQPRPACPPEEFLVMPQDDPAEAEEQAWKEVLLEESLEALRADSSLEPRTLEAYLAYVVENRPAAEVAREFGLTENTLYQIKHRLTRRLRVHAARLRHDGELFP